MTKKTYQDGFNEAFQSCLKHLSSILKSLEITGQKKTKVYVTLTNVMDQFQGEYYSMNNNIEALPTCLQCGRNSTETDFEYETDYCDDCIKQKSLKVNQNTS